MALSPGYQKEKLRPGMGGEKTGRQSPNLCHPRCSPWALLSAPLSPLLFSSPEHRPSRTQTTAWGEELGSLVPSTNLCHIFATQRVKSLFPLPASRPCQVQPLLLVDRLM